MREIKFRGKRVATKKWVYGGYAEYDDHAFIVENGIGSVIIPSTVGQFTGLRDCNGVEIYEGDIIEVRGRYKRVVIWDKIGYALMPCEGYHDKTFWTMNLQHPGEDWWDTFRDEIEVIGNIHDNPELLKGGNQ